MAYIGKTPVIGNFVKLDSITVVNGQAAYTMQNGGVNFTSYDNVNQFLVSLNGVLQAPTDSFTVSSSTLTFASNLSTGDVIDFVLVLGNSLDIGTPSDNTVSLAKLTATGTKDATTFLRGDNTFAVPTDNGKILQIVTAQISSPTTVSSQSNVTTGITANITPSASNSTILVFITGTFSMNVSRATTFCGVNLIRTVGGSDTSLIGGGNNDNIANNVFGASNMQMQGTYAYSHKDSPSTTSEVTYTLKSRIETSGEAIVFNRGGMGSFVTLMEIGA